MPTPFPFSAPRCDVFCNVIDNFGDAGVCWRLVRELAEAHQWQLRLIIDRPALLRKLEPRLAGSLDALRDQGIEVVDWSLAGTLQPAEIVLEAFACQLPPDYLARMRSASRSPVWLNLEYLSAESWVEGCHLLPSPDPLSGIAKYFFFPGFTRRTGGLIRESRINVFRQEMQRPEFRLAWLNQFNIAPADDECLISLFCYPDSPFDALFEAWQKAPRPVHCVLLEGLPDDDLQKMSANATWRGLRVSRMPFLSQDDFDRLLMACEVIFVRGEDSFVRAQWAGRPFVWQPYRQANAVHQEKLRAFLDRYLAALPPSAAHAVEAMHQVWNGFSTLSASEWSAFADHAAAIERHLRNWTATLQANGNLTESLAVFCESKL